MAVVTDSEEIENHVTDFGGRVFRVDDAVASGSERVFLGWKRFAPGDVELIVNVQGDEPLLLGSDLKDLVQFHLDSDFDIATLVTPTGRCRMERFPQRESRLEFRQWQVPVLFPVIGSL